MKFENAKEINKKDIFIIEDDKDIRTSFSLIIGGSIKYQITGAFSSIEQAWPEFIKHPPHIVLMDIHLPGKNGIEGTLMFKTKYPTTEIIMVTVFDDDENVFEALKSGATGYITKSSNFIELLNALDEISCGGAPMSSQIARMVIRNHHLNLNSPLTSRERQILALLARGNTYSMIAEELFISKETSKTHIRNIYSKLHVNSKSGAISKATKEGLI